MYIHTYTEVCMYACRCVKGTRANQRHTRHHRCSRVFEGSLHVRVCVFVYVYVRSCVCVCVLVLFRW
jgi:hypothetical protein